MMELDVSGELSCLETVLRWYRPQETPPSALRGYAGPVLVQVDPMKYGGPVREAWFRDGRWKRVDGGSFEAAEVLAFAIPTPPCEQCGGTGELFEHVGDCDDELCALNGDVHSCIGQVVQCSCRCR